MKLSIKQQNIVRSKARFKIIRAGRRSGKSTVAIEMMLFQAVSKKNQNIFYISPSQKQSRSIIWEATKARLNGIGELNESRLEIALPTQDGGVSRIYVSGFEARENFRGMKAHLIVFDELDTMKGFFVGWQEIFRPALTDTAGKAIFIGTPKKENPNLRRMEKIAEQDIDYANFHFTTADNPHIPAGEIEKARQEVDYQTFRQEYLAEYVENQGALFKYDALVDLFTNTITKTSEKFLIVDVADDGSDKTVFSYWESLEEVEREEYQGLNTEAIIGEIRMRAANKQIPYSNIAVDAIGVGAAVASSSQLAGIVGYKSSFSPIKTDTNIVKVPGIGYLPDATILTSDYKNLRSQCVFKLAEHVNDHKIASRVTGAFREYTIEELSNYQDASTGDGKRMATKKEDVKEAIGRSPDHSDTMIMRMYFVLRDTMTGYTSEAQADIAKKLASQFDRSFHRRGQNNTK